MKTLFAVTFAALASSGCASSPQHMAQAECKIAPARTGIAIHSPRAKPVDPLDAAYARAALANSGYRHSQLAQNGGMDNTIEEALRECDRAR